jgi:Fur family ferric uptake transcriptional regulator
MGNRDLKSACAGQGKSVYFKCELFAYFKSGIFVRYRFTKIRKQVLDLIAESDVPLNASSIHQKLKKVPDLSTVYRALDFLVRERYVQAVTFSRMNFYFIAPEEGGGHFIFCQGCNTIRCFDTCLSHDLERKLQERFHYIFSHHTLCFEGLCSQCRSAGAPVRTP